MPFGDRTGPESLGPRTGRGLGYCSGYNTPGFTKGIPRGMGFGRGRGFGRGFGYGRGFGFGRGFGYRWVQNPVETETVNLSKDEQIRILEQELKQIDIEKQEIKKKLDELKKDKKQ